MQGEGVKTVVSEKCRIFSLLFNGLKKKVKLSLLQAVVAHMVVSHQGFYIF
jgi:hypothetical protein